MRGRALFFYCTCCLIWGSTWLVIKIGLGSFPPLLLTALRFVFAVIPAILAWLSAAVGFAPDIARVSRI